jgi:hypothetical protein
LEKTSMAQIFWFEAWGIKRGLPSLSISEICVSLRGSVLGFSFCQIELS